MIELRWIVRGTGRVSTHSIAWGPILIHHETERVLQYRTGHRSPRRASWDIRWSDWQDVPTETEPPK